ncbi:MAG: hypothetical protein ACRDTG_24850 [Pseudonocardiaceae bacterium]
MTQGKQATESEPPVKKTGAGDMAQTVTNSASGGAATHEEPLTTLAERLRAIAGVVAPTTLIAALLYYYGYVTTYTHFAYFGVDLSTLRMSTQDLALRSVAALYVPIAALLAAGLAAYWLHNAASAALARGRRNKVLRRGGWLTIAAGAVLLIRAVVGIVYPSIARNEFPGITPLSLGLGALLVAYGHHLVVRTSADQSSSPQRRTLERISWALVSGIAVLSLFWLTNSFAGAYGRGQADADSRELTRRPNVTLDTKERLYLRYPGVDETQLPPEDGQEFRYRYRGLRLLIESDARLFLIPERWREGGEVLVLPHDNEVRVQFGR